MSTSDILYFGQVDPAQPKGRYEASTVLNNRKISLDLNFRATQLEPGMDQTINSFLQQLAVYHEQHPAIILEDYKEDGDTLDYIRFFLDEYKPHELRRIIGEVTENKAIPMQLLDKLTLTRIGLYPDDEEGFLAVFDYALYLDGKPQSQVLVVSTNEQGEVEEINWWS